LYELLTGRPPFRADSALQTVMEVLQKDPPPPRALNPRLDRDLDIICLKCLEKEPHLRYPSAQALAQDLEHWLAGAPIAARPRTPCERLVKWLRRHPAATAALALSALAAVLLVVGLVVGIVLIAQEKEQTERALAAARAEQQKKEEALAHARQVERARTA